MALLISITQKGVNIPAAYVRVVSPQISKDKTKIAFGAWVWASLESSAEWDSVLGDFAAGYVAEYDLNGANPFEQAYAHLKTLPEFAGAVDC